MAQNSNTIDPALKAVLRACEPRKWKWGEWDCATGVASEWVRAQTGRDPAAPWRGQYTSQLDFLRLVIRRGPGYLAGMSDMGDEAAKRVGARLTDIPGPGSIGLVRFDAPGVSRLPGFAVCAWGDVYAVTAQRGVTYGRADVIRAWEL